MGRVSPDTGPINNHGWADTLTCMADKMERQRSKQAAERTGRDPFFLAAILSIPMSWYFFFAKKDRERGIFVGLWAPTFLALGSHFRQIRMNEMLERESSDIVSRVQRMVKEQ